MAYTIGELVARLTLDDSDFNAKTQKAGKSWEKLATTSKKTGRIIGMGLIAGATAAGVATTAIVKQGIAFNGLEQKSRAALKTILGSSEKVNVQMDKLNELVMRSPFDKGTFILGQQQLLSFGMAAKNVVPTLDALQNAVAATGGSSRQLGELTYVMAQIQAAGRITGQDLMQFGVRGINAAELIGNAMGKTAEQIKTEISKGAFDADTALSALTKGMTQKFGGAADNVKQTWEGVGQRVRAQIRNIGSTLTKYLVRPSGGGDLIKFTNALGDVLSTTNKQLDHIVDIVYPRIRPAITRAITGVRNLNKAIATFDVRKIDKQLNGLSRYTPAIAGLSGALMTFAAKPIPVLGRLVGGLNPVIGGLALLVATSPELRQVGYDFLSAIRPITPSLGELGRTLLGVSSDIIRELTPAIRASALAFADIVVGIAPVITAFAHTTVAIKPLVQIVAALIEGVASLPTPLLTAAAAFLLLKSNIGSIKAIVSTVVTAFRVFGQQMQVQQSLAAMGGKEIGMFGSAMAVAGKKASGFGNSLMAGLGGPVGVAIAGISLLIGVVTTLIASNQKAKQEVRDLAKAMADSGDQAEETARQFAIDQIQDYATAYREAGGDVRDLTEAALGNADAMARVNAVIEENTEIYNGQYASTTQIKGGLAGLREQLEGAAKTYKDASTTAKDLTAANEDSAKSFEEHKKAVEADTRAMTESANQKRAAIDANYAYQDAQEKVNEVIQTGAKFQGDFADKNVRYNKTNRAVIEGLKGLVETGNRALTTAQENGASQEELNQTMEMQKKAFLDAASAMGLSADQAKQLYDELGALPDVKMMKMEVDIRSAKQKIDVLQLQATAKANKQVDIDPEQAKTVIEELDALAEEGVVKPIDADTLEAAAKNGSLQKLIEKRGTKPIDADTIAALRKDKKLSSDVKKLVSKPVDIKQMGHWGSKIQSWLNQIKPTVSVHAKISGSMADFSARLRAMAKADGGIDYYASGGIRENHVAQIARAGTWRVWAEPETGGEAYIPLSPSKRSRSTQILNQVATDFGYRLIPAQSQTYAKGSSAISGVSAGETVINNYFNIVNPNPRATADLIMRELQGAPAMAEVAV